MMDQEFYLISEMKKLLKKSCLTTFIYKTDGEVHMQSRDPRNSEIKLVS